jgi:hypothetical protein
MSEAYRIGEVTKAWAEAQKIKTIYFKQTTSTNDIAKDQADSDEIAEHDIVLYLADDQTQGRGRFERTWQAPKPGSSLLCSWSFVVDEMPLPTFTLRAGLAVITAAQATWPYLNWSLKAPNDILINDKKVAGLLVETVSQGNSHRLIFGLGFNVLNHPSSQAQATSLLQEMVKLKTPFVGDDWLLFCERLLFEICACINTSSENFSEPVEKSILFHLNKNPLLTNTLYSLDEVIDQIER